MRIDRLESVAFALALAASTSAQTLVKDINAQLPTTPMSASPNGFTTAGAHVYFSAYEPGSGAELWRSDGTEAGTELVLDIRPGEASSSPGHFAALDDTTVVFRAQTNEFGYELWKSDGTPGGTQLVKNIAPGWEHGSPVYMTQGQPGVVYFIADDDVHGAELWRTDGTTSGTWMVVDAVPGPEGTNDPPIVFDEHVYWPVDTETATGELWVTDGTEAGSGPLPSVQAFSHASNLYVFDNLLLFSAHHLGGGGIELFRTDGTELGTHLLHQSASGFQNGSPSNFARAGDQVYFSAELELLGTELFKTDGTSDGSGLVIALGPGTTFGAGSDPVPMGAVGDQMLFSATTTTYGRELWITDGTEEGTELLLDIGGPGLSSNPSGYVSLDGIAYFQATAPGIGRELWRSDGTPAGTYPVVDLLPGSASSDIGNLSSFDGELIFNANSGDGNELHMSDGTASGTVQIVEIAEEATSVGSDPTNLTRLDSDLIFSADDGVHGRELWISDGTEEGTQLLADIHPGGPSAHVDDLARVGEHVWFAATDGVVGIEPWLTDGTPGGTRMVVDIHPDGNSDPSGFTRAGDRVVFAAVHPNLGRELWLSDGTGPGTVQANLAPGVGWSNPDHFTPLGDKAFFSASLSETGNEPWITDGTIEGTMLLADLAPGNYPAIQHSSSSPPGADRMVYKDELWFWAISQELGSELYRTDGTPQGTVLAADLSPGPASSSPRYFAVVGDLLVFRMVAYGAVRLMATDGTDFELIDTDGMQVQSPIISNGPTGFCFIGGNSLGRFLWRTDGTDAGTLQVIDDPLDINYQDPFFGDPGSGPPVLFTASDGPSGRELWTTSGGEANTMQVADIAPGPGSSSPRLHTRVGETLFFIADDGDRGVELYSMPVVDLDEYVTEPYGEGCGGPVAGPPTLTAAGRAVVDEVFDVQIGNVIPSSAAVIAYSFTLFPTPLLDGCTWYLGPGWDALTPVVVTPAGSLSLPVQPSGSMVGVPIYLQLVGSQVGAPLFGAYGTSSVLEIVVGW